MGLFRSTISAIRKGLTRTREALTGGLRGLLLGRTLDEELITEIERRLITADVGVKATSSIIEQLRTDFRAGRISRGEDVLERCLASKAERRFVDAQALADALRGIDQSPARAEGGWSWYSPSPT